MPEIVKMNVFNPGLPSNCLKFFGVFTQIIIVDEHMADVFFLAHRLFGCRQQGDRPLFAPFSGQGGFISLNILPSEGCYFSSSCAGPKRKLDDSIELIIRVLGCF